MSRPMRRLIVGNWKMNRTVPHAVALVRSLLPLLPHDPEREVAIAPPFTALAAVASLLQGSAVGLAAQDLFWEDEGPYTGEISGVLLQDAGVRYVLVAHSERRRHLEETDRVAALKVRAALRCGLKPILCVGEDEAERAAGRAGAVVRAQMTRALEGSAPGETPCLQIAYEPVWAIGSGRPATATQVAEMHDLIRSVSRGLFGEASPAVRVLYGGSVTPDNVDDLMRTPGVDGLLVGGASLDAAQFARIVSYRS